ncbi:hypothetical protein [Streptomyces sp. NBC_01320]|uniref:hypothetical protein n=1 Tax=Streptomyces sp. NBC_01320 TaxID=2903824 RepID=UPI002E11B0AE|nr:hypothetical protein OG395_03775 [Streptomyces sp. NBC_01320]
MLVRQAVQLSLVPIDATVVAPAPRMGILGALDATERRAAVTALARLIAKAAARQPTWAEEDSDD